MSTNENARPDGTSGAGEKMVSAVNRQPNCTAADRRRAQRRAISPSDYRAIADEALRTFDAVIARWLPGGKFEGREYVVRNPTRNDKRPGSFKVNRDTGQWADFATGDKGADLVSLVALDST
jgi:hypothetical protein